jgi:anion-transporting  ArsA/GET3 family ATPase
MEALTQAKEVVDAILEMMENFTLTGDKENEEAESEAYIALIDEREPLVEELTDLRQQITDEEVATPEFEEIKRVIEKITTLDKRYADGIKHHHKNAQTSYREIRQGRRIFAGYNPLPGDEVSSKFNVMH